MADAFDGLAKTAQLIMTWMDPLPNVEFEIKMREEPAHDFRA